MINPNEWTALEDARLCDMIADGATLDEVAAKLERRSPAAIKTRRLKLRLPQFAGEGTLHKEQDWDELRPQLIRATQRHLNDLASAGHDPKALDQPMKRMTPRWLSPPTSMSLIGSSAAMCADNAGRGY